MNRKKHKGGRVSHIHTINVGVQVSIYNLVSLLLGTAMVVRGKMCQIIVKLLETLTPATTKASVETHA